VEFSSGKSFILDVQAAATEGKTPKFNYCTKSGTTIGPPTVRFVKQIFAFEKSSLLFP